MTGPFQADIQAVAATPAQTILTNQPTDVAIVPMAALGLTEEILVDFWALLTVGAGTTSVTVTLAVHNLDGSGGGTVQAFAIQVPTGVVGNPMAIPFKWDFRATQDWSNGASIRVALTQNSATGNGTVNAVCMSVTI